MKINNHPFCSIVVLNYYGEKILRITLDSLLRLDYPKDKYEIIIVDNNSKDKSKEIINRFIKTHKNIKGIFLKQNLGFAKGNNIGIQNAQGKYVILLNNDCIVNINWLKELVNTAEKDEKIFAVNSKIKLFKTNKIQNAGIMAFQDGYARDIGAIVKYQSQDYEEDINQYATEKDIYAACGAAVLFRKNVFSKIGFLDERFFMYYEDVEISERARFHGFKIKYCPKAEVYHHHAYSIHEWSPLFIYHVEKGRLLHTLYHFPLKVYFRQYMNFTLAAFSRIISEIFLIKKYVSNIQYLKVSLYLITLLPFLLVERVKKHNNISKTAIADNYNKILIGDWYFN